jgi:hypothetical protein
MSHLTKNKKTKVVNIYLKETNRPHYLNLIDILDRENTTFSDWVWEQAGRYVNLHHPGNPQQCIDTILALGKPYNANGCFECGRKPKYQTIYKKKQVLLCQVHFDKLRPRLVGWREL